MNTKYCTNCGSEIQNSNSKFCTGCGTQILQDGTAAQAADGGIASKNRSAKLITAYIVAAVFFIGIGVFLVFLFSAQNNGAGHNIAGVQNQTTQDGINDRDDVQTHEPASDDTADTSPDDEFAEDAEPIPEPEPEFATQLPGAWQTELNGVTVELRFYANGLGIMYPVSLFSYNIFEWADDGSGSVIIRYPSINYVFKNEYHRLPYSIEGDNMILDVNASLSFARSSYIDMPQGDTSAFAGVWGSPFTFLKIYLMEDGEGFYAGSPINWFYEEILGSGVIFLWGDYSIGASKSIAYALEVQDADTFFQVLEPGRLTREAGTDDPSHPFAGDWFFDEPRGSFAGWFTGNVEEGVIAGFSLVHDMPHQDWHSVWGFSAYDLDFSFQSEDMSERRPGFADGLWSFEGNNIFITFTGRDGVLVHPTRFAYFSGGAESWLGIGTLWSREEGDLPARLAQEAVVDDRFTEALSAYIGRQEWPIHAVMVDVDGSSTEGMLLVFEAELEWNPGQTLRRNVVYYIHDGEMVSSEVNVRGNASVHAYVTPDGRLATREGDGMGGWYFSLYEISADGSLVPVDAILVHFDHGWGRVHIHDLNDGSHDTISQAEYEVFIAERGLAAAFYAVASHDRRRDILSAGSPD